MNQNRNTVLSLLGGLFLGAGLVWISSGKNPSPLAESSPDALPLLTEEPTRPASRTFPETPEPTPLTGEDLARVRLVASLCNPGSDPRLRYRIFNGTGKTLAGAEIRVEGTQPSGLPLGRVSRLSLSVPPQCDWSESERLPGGPVTTHGVQGLRITLVSASAH